MNNGEPWLGNQSLIFLFIEINDCNFPCGGAGEWGELCKKKGLLLEECRPHTRHSLTITTLHRVTWRSLRQQELSWGKAGLMGSPSQPGSFPESQWIWVHLIWLLQAWLCFHALHGALSKQHTFDKLSIKQVLRGNTVLQLTSRTVAPGRPRNEWWAATCEAGYCSEESSLSSTVVWECHEDSLGHTGNLVGSFPSVPYISLCVLSRVLLFVTPWTISGSSVRGISQKTTLEWVAICYSRGSSWLRDWTCISSISCISRQILYHCITREVSDIFTLSRVLL